MNFYHSTNENIVILFEYLFERSGIGYNNEYLSVTVALKEYKNSNCCHTNHDFYRVGRLINLIVNFYKLTVKLINLT